MKTKVISWLFLSCYVLKLHSTSLTSRKESNYRLNQTITSLNDVFQEYEKEIDSFLFQFTNNNQLMWDMNILTTFQELPLNLNHFIFYFNHKSCDNSHENISENTMICVENENDDFQPFQRLLDDQLTPQLFVPTVIRVHDNNGILFHGTHVLQLKKTLFYVRNEFESVSEDLIEMFVQAGYVVFWHLSTSISRTALQTIKLSSLSKIPSSHFVSINLVAIPEEFSSVIFQRLQQSLGHVKFFPYRAGLYHISQVCQSLSLFCLFVSISIVAVSVRKICCLKRIHSLRNK